MSVLLEVKALSKRFSRKDSTGQAFNAVSGVDFLLEEGGFLTVTGHSGSGKTTMLTMLAGLITPSSGEVLFRGTNIFSLSDRRLSHLRSKEISFIPQGAELLGNISIYDNVRSPQLFSGGDAEDSGRVDYLLYFMGIGALAEEYPANLSGGEKRRVAIARALFNRPALILADEPTSDLDPENTVMILDLLKKINAEGTGIVMVTHDENAAACGTMRTCMAGGMLEPC